MRLTLGCWSCPRSSRRTPLVAWFQVECQVRVVAEGKEEGGGRRRSNSRGRPERHRVSDRVREGELWCRRRRSHGSRSLRREVDDPGVRCVCSGLRVVLSASDKDAVVVELDESIRCRVGKHGWQLSRRHDRLDRAVQDGLRKEAVAAVDVRVAVRDNLKARAA